MQKFAVELNLAHNVCLTRKFQMCRILKNNLRNKHTKVISKHCENTTLCTKLQ